MPTDSGYPDTAPAIDQLLETLCHPVRREIIDYGSESGHIEYHGHPEARALLDDVRAIF